jgi:hypothetical protein
MLPLGRRGPIKIKCLAGSVSTVGGLGLSRRDLDRDSRSRRRKKVSPWSGKSRQFQKVSLDFVSTPPSSSKSLDRDRETGRDMTFWANLDQFVSISIESWSISSHFSIEISQLVEIFYPEVPQKVSIMSRYLDKPRKVSTNLENPDSFDLCRRSR